MLSFSLIVLSLLDRMIVAYCADVLLSLELGIGTLSTNADAVNMLASDEEVMHNFTA